MSLSRRSFLVGAGLSAASIVALRTAVAEQLVLTDELTVDTIEQAEKVVGITFTPDEREQILDELIEHLDDFSDLRAVQLRNEVEPALYFNPAARLLDPGTEQGASTTTEPTGWTYPEVTRPADDSELAFMTIAELGFLLRSGAVTSRELTDLFLSRLHRYDPVLRCVVTFLDSRARESAHMADEELRDGVDRGPLHGIPYGAKDLLAVSGYPTTWGATPYQDQTLDYTAEIIRRLDEAGAVLVAKLSLGALAWGDVWYKGRTNNPWNLDQGSSGSSAGPGAAVAAGLMPFAIGSETLGSIVSPSTRNGVTGYRPSFGTISRHGAMTLSWSMDKLGPMARSADCCARVFDIVRGPDPRDPATRDIRFSYKPSLDVSSLTIGFVADAFKSADGYRNAASDAESLDVLRSMGAELVPIALPDDLPVGAMLITLQVEAAAAFDELTRSTDDDSMVRQDLWPKTFKAARFIPAVEYVQANRQRTLLMERMAETMTDIDAFVSPSFRGGTLRITNLTGHPCACIPNAFHRLEDNALSERRSPGSISLIGNLYSDDVLLSIANAYQQRTGFHRMRPPVR